MRIFPLDLAHLCQTGAVAFRGLDWGPWDTKTTRNAVLDDFVAAWLRKSLRAVATVPTAEDTEMVRLGTVCAPNLHAVPAKRAMAHGGTP